MALYLLPACRNDRSLGFVHLSLVCVAAGSNAGISELFVRKIGADWFAFID
jgi:hypothetical protein